MEIIDTFYITNNGGTNGYAKVETGLIYQLAPVKEKDYTKSNPETLLGASLATCLNATMIPMLRFSNINGRSLVQVKIDMAKNELNRLVFLVSVKVGIEGVDLDTTEKFMHKADERCPVSNLFNKELLSFKAVDYSELSND